MYYHILLVLRTTSQLSMHVRTTAQTLLPLAYGQFADAPTIDYFCSSSSDCQHKKTRI